MKVYIVQNIKTGKIHGVFSTHEKAEDYINGSFNMSNKEIEVK